jgi:hypothetical protein
MENVAENEMTDQVYKRSNFLWTNTSFNTVVASRDAQHSSIFQQLIGDVLCRS